MKEQKKNNNPRECNFVFDKWPAMPRFEATIETVRGNRLLIGPVERYARKLFDLSRNQKDWQQPFMVRVDIQSLKAEGINEGQVKMLVELLKLGIYLFHFGRVGVRGYKSGIEIYSAGYMTLPKPDLPKIYIN